MVIKTLCTMLNKKITSNDETFTSKPVKLGALNIVYVKFMKQVTVTLATQFATSKAQ